MPSSLVVTKEDERLWEKAKTRAQEEGKGENYAYIMGIYKRMNPDRFKGASAAFVASRFLSAYDEKGPNPEGAWEHGAVEPIQPTDGEGSQVPPARDNQGQPLEPPKLPKVNIPGVGKHAASSLRSPSSPRSAEPLSTREEHEAWDAGYEWTYRHNRKEGPLDLDTLFLQAKRVDRRLPRGITESDPQFWEWHWAFAEGAAAAAESYSILVEGIPRGIRTASGEREMLGVDVRSIAARGASWWNDLEALVKEYWSLQRFPVKRSRGKLEFTVDHYGTLSVAVVGPPTSPTVWVGGVNRKFNQEASLWDILMWIDEHGRGRGFTATDR